MELNLKRHGAKASRPRTRSLKALSWATLIVMSVIGFFVYQHHRVYSALREEESALAVGYAALLYVREYGVPPASVEELLEKDVLRVTRDARSVGVPGRISGLATLENALRVQLSFPREPAEYELEAARVVAKGTGKELICLWLRDGAREREDLLRVNRHVARIWLKVASGQATGLQWLDEVELP